MTQGPQNPSEVLLSYFTYAHLPEDLREVSKLYADLAHEVYHRLPASAESTVALRKLLESKDCAVRAALALRKQQAGLAVARETTAEWCARVEREMAERRKLPPHLDYVELHEFTENIPREHGEERSGRCQAWPARAFQAKYPGGCLRRMRHTGAHSAVEATAKRMDDKDAHRGGS